MVHKYEGENKINTRENLGIPCNCALIRLTADGTIIMKPPGRKVIHVFPTVPS